MTSWANVKSVLVVVASLTLVAGLGCSDDPVDNQNDNQIEEDAGLDADDGTDDVANDVEDAGEDADADEGSGNGEDDNYDPEDFDVEPVECAFPPGPDEEDCPEGDFGPATFFSEFEIADDPDNPCCFDLDGDTDDPENYDNIIGEMILPAVEGSLEGFEDVNENIESSIAAGYLLYLLEAYRWEHPGWDDALKLNVYRGADVNGVADALQGNGEFHLDPDDFDEEGNPHFGFDQVRVVEDGRMEAEAGRVEITLPSLVEGLGVVLADVRMHGDVVQDPEPDLTAGGGFSIENGEMGGVLLRDEFYKTLNEAAHECDCFDFEYEDPDNPDPWTEGVFRFMQEEDADEDDFGTWTCQVGKSLPEDACEDGPPRCQTLGDESLCSILDPFADPGADVTDMVVDGEIGYSVGTRFESVPADIIGVEGEGD